MTGVQTCALPISTKIGMVLLILGAMHFFNLAVFNKLRNTKLAEARFAPVNAGGAANAGLSRFRQTLGNLEE